MAEYFNLKTIPVDEVKKGNKIHANNAWWKVLMINKIEGGYNIDMNAYFKGYAKVFIKNGTLLKVNKTI